MQRFMALRGSGVGAAAAGRDGKQHIDADMRALRLATNSMQRNLR